MTVGHSVSSRDLFTLLSSQLPSVRVGMGQVPAKGLELLRAKASGDVQARETGHPV